MLSSVSQGNRNKSKNKQMGPNQIYKLLYSKGNNKQNKAHIIIIIKPSKIGQKIQIDISSKDTDGQQAHERLFIIANYQINLNKKIQHGRHLPKPLRMAIFTKPANNK